MPGNLRAKGLATGSNVQMGAVGLFSLLSREPAEYDKDRLNVGLAALAGVFDQQHEEDAGTTTKPERRVSRVLARRFSNEQRKQVQQNEPKAKSESKQQETNAVAKAKARALAEAKRGQGADGGD